MTEPATNSQAIGELALEFIDKLENDHGDQLQVGTIAIIAEVNSDNETFIHYRCNDERAWIQRGIFQAALHASDQNSESVEDDDE